MNYAWDFSGLDWVNFIESKNDPINLSAKFSFLGRSFGSPHPSMRKPAEIRLTIPFIGTQF
jgi:hypothetical protein